MSRYRHKRLRYHAWGLLLIPLTPILVPTLGVAVYLDDVGRARELPRPRHATWFWRIWWWYGYHGIYKLAWNLNRERAQRAS